MDKLERGGFVRAAEIQRDVLKEVMRRSELRQRLEAERGARSAMRNFLKSPNAPVGSSCESPERGCTMMRDYARGQSPKVSTIREARAHALCEYLHRHDYLTMDKSTYAMFELKGWLRRELDRAIEDLIVKGEANLETFGTTLEVTPVCEGIIT